MVRGAVVVVVAIAASARYVSAGGSVSEGGAIDEKRAYREVHAINKRYKEAFSIATELRILPGTTVTVDGEPSDLAVDGGVPTDEVIGTDERSSKLGAAVQLLAENIDIWREIQQFVNGKRQLATYESEVASVMAHSRALLGLAKAGSDNDSWRKQATDELDKACPVLWGRHIPLRGADVATLWIECYTTLFELHRDPATSAEAARVGADGGDDGTVVRLDVDHLFEAVAGSDMAFGASLGPVVGSTSAEGSGESLEQGAIQTGQLVSSKRLRFLARTSAEPEYCAALAVRAVTEVIVDSFFNAAAMAVGPNGIVGVGVGGGVKGVGRNDKEVRVLLGQLKHLHQALRAKMGGAVQTKLNELNGERSNLDEFDAMSKRYNAVLAELSHFTYFMHGIVNHGWSWLDHELAGAREDPEAYNGVALPAGRAAAGGQTQVQGTFLSKHEVVRLFAVRKSMPPTTADADSSTVAGTGSAKGTGAGAGAGAGKGKGKGNGGSDGANSRAKGKERGKGKGGDREAWKQQQQQRRQGTGSVGSGPGRDRAEEVASSSSTIIMGIVTLFVIALLKPPPMEPSSAPCLCSSPSAASPSKQPEGAATTSSSTAAVQTGIGDGSTDRPIANTLSSSHNGSSPKSRVGSNRSKSPRNSRGKKRGRLNTAAPPDSKAGVLVQLVLNRVRRNVAQCIRVMRMLVGLGSLGDGNSSSRDGCGGSGDMGVGGATGGRVKRAQTAERAPGGQSIKAQVKGGLPNKSEPSGAVGSKGGKGESGAAVETDKENIEVAEKMTVEKNAKKSANEDESERRLNGEREKEGGAKGSKARKRRKSNGKLQLANGGGGEGLLVPATLEPAVERAAAGEKSPAAAARQARVSGSNAALVGTSTPLAAKDQAFGAATHDGRKRGPKAKSPTTSSTHDVSSDTDGDKRVADNGSSDDNRHPEALRDTAQLPEEGEVLTRAPARTLAHADSPGGVFNDNVARKLGLGFGQDPKARNVVTEETDTGASSQVPSSVSTMDAAYDSATDTKKVKQAAKAMSQHPAKSQDKVEDNENEAGKEEVNGKPPKSGKGKAKAGGKAKSEAAKAEGAQTTASLPLGHMRSRAQSQPDLHTMVMKANQVQQAQEPAALLSRVDVRPLGQAIPSPQQATPGSPGSATMMMMGPGRSGIGHAASMMPGMLQGHKQGSRMVRSSSTGSMPSMQSAQMVAGIGPGMGAAMPNMYPMAGGVMGSMGSMNNLNMMQQMPNQGQMNGQMNYGMVPMNANMSGYPMPSQGQVPRMMGMQVPMSPMQGIGGSFPIMQQPLGTSPQQPSPQQTQQVASQLASQQTAALQMQQMQHTQAQRAQAQAVQAQAQTHAVRRQIDYYFSEENLSRDRYLKSKMDKDSYVALSEIAQFNRIKALTTQYSTLIAAVQLSNVLDVLNIDGQFKVRARRASILFEAPPTLGVLDRAEAAISNGSISADASPDASPVTSASSSPVSLGGQRETAEDSARGSF